MVYTQYWYTGVHAASFECAVYGVQVPFKPVWIRARLAGFCLASWGTHCYYFPLSASACGEPALGFPSKDHRAAFTVVTPEMHPTPCLVSEHHQNEKHLLGTEGFALTEQALPDTAIIGRLCIHKARKSHFKTRTGML